MLVNNLNLAVACDSPELLEQAKDLAKRLGLPFDNQASKRLLLSSSGLSLSIHPFLPLYADFSSATWQKRRMEGKKQGIVRACKPAAGLRILDTTAGWGRDAAVLASLGAEVLMLERNPIMAALLADALARRDDTSMRLSLLNQDAKDYLQGLAPENYPHVIYIDPMHPERHKAALVKKDLQVLQQMIGPDEDSLALLELARKRCTKKVVLKWPESLPPLQKPGSSIEGKTIRFDVFLPA